MPLDATTPLHDGFRLRRCETTRRPLCRYCGETFTPHDARQEFCTPRHKREWLGFWQAKGPALAKLLYAYRIERKKGALSDLCNLFSDQLDDFRKKREKLKGTKI